jgi:hypothetical protein
VVFKKIILALFISFFSMLTYAQKDSVKVENRKTKRKMNTAQGAYNPLVLLHP